MNTHQKAWIVAAVVIVAILGYWFGRQSVTAPTTDQPAANEQVCAQVITYAHAADNGEIKQFATPCEVPAGWVTVADMIQFDNLLHGEKVVSPLEIFGSAPGPWYFEGSFPVELTDADGNVLATAAAQAKGEWMTTAMVPFGVKLEFGTGSAVSGTLKFKNDNPSGDPAKDLWYNVLVNFQE